MYPSTPSTTIAMPMLCWSRSPELNDVLIVMATGQDAVVPVPILRLLSTDVVKLSTGLN